MTTPLSVSANKLWPRSTSLLLLFIGLILSVSSFAVVVSMPDLLWHGARDAELRATSSTYQETGVLLIKPTGSGSYGVQAPSTGPLASAAWDDDPGAYIIASLIGRITNADSPYPGLTLFQGILVALPLLWLPLAVARVFRSARAGYSLLLLPLVVWVTNRGTWLIGTEYGLSDQVSTLPVYSLYGFAASFAFLSLSLLLLFSTYRLKLPALATVSLLIGVLAGIGNLTRSMSGTGVAIAVGILWWLHNTGRWRWFTAIGASLLALSLAVGIPNGVMSLINADRTEATSETLEQIPDAHTAWHSLYLGLSYPQPLTGVPSPFDVTWADEFGWEKARGLDPNIVIASEEYDEVLKSLYLSEVTSDPIAAVKLYVKKSIFLLSHFGAMVGFIAFGFLVTYLRLGRPRRSLGITVCIVLPTLVLGLIPPIMVMPMLYYYSELSAALGLLAAVALGGLMWSLSTTPLRIRARERRRLAYDPPCSPHSHNETSGVSIVIAGIPSEADLKQATRDLSVNLSREDEIIVVANHASLCSEADLDPGQDADSPRYTRVTAPDDVGEALRAGVLASSGHAVLVGTHPIVLTLDQVTALRSIPKRVIMTASVERSSHNGWRGSVLRATTKVLLQDDLEASYTAVALDGPWARQAARASRESTIMWTTELVSTALSQGFEAELLPKRAHIDVATSSSPSPNFRETVAGSLRIAVNRSRDIHD